ncbi:MAG: peptidylprolyl isomerase [Pseudomonadota bacterium]
MILKPAHLLLAMLTAAAVPAFAQTEVTVNGKPILTAKIDKYTKSEAAAGNKADPAQLRTEVKNKLIEIEVLRQEAEKQGYGIRSEVKDAVENARQNITISAMLADWMSKNPATDAEIKAEYDKYIAAMGDKEYRARHILVPTEDEAKAIIAKLKTGGKFEELAKQSKDSSANNGGDLGWNLPGKFVPEFSKSMVSLKNGSYTETPIKTQFGYHVIKLEESRPAPKLETVKAQVAEVVKQRKLQDYREGLRNKAVLK